MKGNISLESIFELLEIMKHKLFSFLLIVLIFDLNNNL